MNQNLEQLKTKFEQLNERERVLVIAALVVLLIFIPYQLIWAPIVNSVEQRRAKVEKQERDLVWMQSKVSEIQQLSRTSSGVEKNSQSLYGIVEKTARQKFGQEIRVQQEDKQGIRIRIQESNFDAVLLWLDELQVQHKIFVKDFKIDRGKNIGNINAAILVEG